MKKVLLILAVAGIALSSCSKKKDCTCKSGETEVATVTDTKEDCDTYTDEFANLGSDVKCTED